MKTLLPPAFCPLPLLEDKMGPGIGFSINSLLREHRNKVIQEQLITSLSQETQDPQYQQEIQEWDSVVGDGINDKVITPNNG